MSRRDELAANLASVQSRITNPNVTLIVVTKTYPVSDVQILSELGITHFGENRNEEGLEKSSAIEATWHYQGEIQSRKLRDIAQWQMSFIHWIHQAILQSLIRLPDPPLMFFSNSHSMVIHRVGESSKLTCLSLLIQSLPPLI